MDVGDADQRAKRGAYRLAGDDRLGAGNLRSGDVQFGPGPVDFFLSGGHFLVLVLLAIEHRLGKSSLRLLRLQLGLFDGDIERH